MAGCYEALSGGQTGDAMVDFTGGVDEMIDLVGGGYRGDDQKRKTLFKVCENYIAKQSHFVYHGRVCFRNAFVSIATEKCS